MSSQPPLHYTHRKPPPLSTKQKIKNGTLYAEPDIIAADLSCPPVIYDSCVVCTGLHRLRICREKCH